MADDDSDLVDFSIVELPRAPTTCVVQLLRASVEDRWGFLLYNNRFPLMVGKVDNATISASLFKGDVIVAINGVSVVSFESAAQIMRAAGLELNLTIDLGSEFRQERLREEKAVAAQLNSTSASSSGQKASVDIAAFSDAASPSIASKNSGDSSHPSSSHQRVLRVDPITVTPSRSNVDVVLVHLPKPPRVATYNKHDCPFGPEYGFTEAFHKYIQDFLTEQALGGSSPTNDLRFDAITAVMRSGIARLPNELIRDITQRGGEVLRKQETNSHLSGTEKDRFMTQMNSMNSVIQDKKRERQEAVDAARQRDAASRVRIKESMQLYHRMCGDGDDNLFVTSLPSSSARANDYHYQQHGQLQQQHADALPLPAQPSAAFQTLMHHAMASAPPPVPSPQNADQSGAGDVTIHIPLSRKQRKKRRVQQLKEQVQATHLEILAASPIPSLESVGLPLPPAAFLQQLGGLVSTPRDSDGSDLPLPPSRLDLL